MEIIKIERNKYPDYLQEKFSKFNDSPDCLYYLGDISLIKQNVIAVIGKRDATSEDLQNAYNYGKEKAQQGNVVLNGLAIGCDTSAIKGALSAKGKVIAVMPCGLHSIYPSRNRDLAIQILRYGGCLISQFTPDSSVNKYSFLQRDKVQVMLSNQVVAITTNETGGTAYTLRYAKKNSVSTVSLSK